MDRIGNEDSGALSVEQQKGHFVIIKAHVKANRVELIDLVLFIIPLWCTRRQIKRDHPGEKDNNLYLSDNCCFTFQLRINYAKQALFFKRVL